MNEILVVVDMQKDFIDGALGTPEAQAILPGVVAYTQGFEGRVVFTRDTHTEDYMNTQEGSRLPVPHCIQGTPGWQLAPALQAIADEKGCPVFDKPTFGSTALAHWLAAEQAKAPIDRVVLVGLCTDICVISNALCIKAALPEVPVAVVAGCCAGVTPASHANALEAMKMCQVDVL
ncbi:MAG: cysteine hydrolase [Oscillospiraceae bacterium]|nr:cysteine hydrolase [Oscillospiraceae bacterium]